MVSGRGGCVTRRCFVSDRARLVMPAFGAFAGGLNVRARPFSDVFGTLGFVAYVLGEERIPCSLGVAVSCGMSDFFVPPHADE